MELSIVLGFAMCFVFCVLFWFGFLFLFISPELLVELCPFCRAQSAYVSEQK